MHYDRLLGMRIGYVPFLAAWFVIGFLLPPAVAVAAPEAAPATAAKLVKVVVLSRHGVRSPTDDQSTLDTWTTRTTPWPTWSCSAAGGSCQPGQLTTRGAQLARQMGTYYAGLLAPLVADGCPSPNDVFFWADRDDSGDPAQRTRATAVAIFHGFRPQCPAWRYVNRAMVPEDPIFHPVNQCGCTFDGAKAEQEINAQYGDLTQYVTKYLFKERNIAQRSLRCCEPAACQVCGHARSSCNLASLPTCINTATLSVDGGLGIGSTFSEILLFEYASALRPKDVGWGGIDRDPMVEQFTLNTTVLGLMRTPYLAHLLGSRLLNKILLALEGQSGDVATGTAPADAKFVVYVGHDTNIANVAELLQLSWQQAASGYQPNQTPPAGALIFELWRTDGGVNSVKVFYTAQALDDMRALTGEHPVKTPVPVPGCGGGGAPCSLHRFAQLVQQNLDPDLKPCWQ